MSEHYFTPEQQVVLDHRFQAIEANWQEMLGLAHDVMRDGTELSSVKVHALASYWQQIMKSLSSKTDLQLIWRRWSSRSRLELCSSKLDGVIVLNLEVALGLSVKQ